MFEFFGFDVAAERLASFTAQVNYIAAAVAAIGGGAYEEGYAQVGNAVGISTMQFAITLAYTTVASLILGLCVSLVYRYKSEFSQSLAMTLVMLPALVQIIIMLASGHVGVGIAVAGAFSLIRFRSVSGTAREIAHLFFAMSLGFVTGMGLIPIAFLFMVLMVVASLLLTITNYGHTIDDTRRLIIKIPESLEYDGLFDDVFEKYTNSVELDTVRTSQMGSLFELKYSVTLKDPSISKAFIDEIRVRNGNLNVIITQGKFERGPL